MWGKVVKIMHILAFILFIVIAAIISAFQGDFSGIKAIAPWVVGIGLFILFLYVLGTCS